MPTKTKSDTELLDWMIAHFAELKEQSGQIDLLELEERYGECLEFLEEIRAKIERF